MLGWAREIAGDDFHSIASVTFRHLAPDEVRARCRRVLEGALEESSNPTQRCERCEAALVEVGMVMRGLRELREATT